MGTELRDALVLQLKSNLGDKVMGEVDIVVTPPGLFWIFLFGVLKLPDILAHLSYVLERRRIIFKVLLRLRIALAYFISPSDKVP